MERHELVQRLVLNSMCDDFENVDQIIFPTVAREGLMLGITVERSEVVDTLRGLVEDGMAKAYLLSLSTRDPFETDIMGMPPIDVIEADFQTYFYITKKGMDFHTADDTWWPFNDDETDSVRS